MIQHHLTPTQSALLHWMRDFQIRSGSMPTRREICEHFNWKSYNAAECHLRAIASKGFIEIAPGTSRGARFTDKAWALLRESEPQNPRPSTSVPAYMLALPVVDPMRLRRPATVGEVPA